MSGRCGRQRSCVRGLPDTDCSVVLQLGPYPLREMGASPHTRHAPGQVTRQKNKTMLLRRMRVELLVSFKLSDAGRWLGHDWWSCLQNMMHPSGECMWRLPGTTSLEVINMSNVWLIRWTNWATHSWRKATSCWAQEKSSTHLWYLLFAMSRRADSDSIRHSWLIVRWNDLPLIQSRPPPREKSRQACKFLPWRVAVLCSQESTLPVSYQVATWTTFFHQQNQPCHRKYLSLAIWNTSRHTETEYRWKLMLVGIVPYFYNVNISRSPHLCSLNNSTLWYCSFKRKSNALVE